MHGKRRIRGAKLRQEGDRVDAAELEVDDEAPAPAARKPWPDNRMENLVGVLQHVAEEPVEGGVLSRAEAERVVAPVVDERVAERAPLERPVVHGNDPRPALRRAVAPAPWGGPEVADSLPGARLGLDDAIRLLDLEVG